MNADQPSDERQIPRGELQPRSNWQTQLLKLFAVVAICGVVVALLLPAFRSARGPARRNSCLNNLKQIGLALNKYAEVHGHYPPAYTIDAEGKRLHSWRTLILPYMEQKALYNLVDLTKPWDDPANARAANSVIECYRCPSIDFEESGSPLTTYLAIVGDDSVIRAADSATLQDTEKVAATAPLVIDFPQENAVHWMSPHDADEELALGLFANNGPKSQHPTDLFLVLFADCHGSTISKGADPAALRAMMTVSAEDDDAIDK